MTDAFLARSRADGHRHGARAAIPVRQHLWRLPERFYARLAPTPVAAPRADPGQRGARADAGPRSGSVWLAPDGVETLAGNRVPEGAEPLAMAYAGHQFGNWVPQLGDGRAILLGEVRGSGWRAPRHPAQGLGPDAVFTQWRRPRRARPGAARVHRQRGDGGARHPAPRARSPLVATGEQILRQEGMLPGAVLTRVSRKPCPRRHLRVLRQSRRRGSRAPARRLCHRAALSRRGAERRSPIARCWTR